jgi:hypothetical protein
VRLRARNAMNAADERGAWMLADVEAKLAAKYKFDDTTWSSLTTEAKNFVAETDERIAKICRDRGIPEDFRPEIDLSWYDRGENACAKRRAELRRVAQTQIEAMVLKAKVEIDHEEERQLSQLCAAGLTSEQAKCFLASMPDATSLLRPSIIWSSTAAR